MKPAPPPPTPAAQPTAATPQTHRIDMRLHPTILATLDRMATEQRLTRTAMMEKLVTEAAGHAGTPVEEPTEEQKVAAHYEATKPVVPTAKRRGMVPPR